MSTPSDAVLDELTGGPVRHLGQAENVEQVTAADVEAARQAAEQAEAKASESQKQAIAGTVGHDQAVSDREAAAFSRLRASLTERKAARHAQAERLRALDAAGQAAIAHAGKLDGIRSATEADLAQIAKLEQGIHDRHAAWNAELDELIGQAAALEPEKPRPGGLPAPSSADVYAGGHGSAKVFVIKHQVLHPIREDHPHGAVAAVDAALEVTRQHDPAARLLIAPSGLVTPLARDPAGHLARRIANGELRELSLPEKERYFNGDQVSY